MSKRKDAKLVYAQSSDIKARSYIEYRKDMKKKAIAELEIKEWLDFTFVLLYNYSSNKEDIKWKEIYLNK